MIDQKNWLFAGANAGGETFAEAMTIIESAKLSGDDSEAYLADIPARIVDHKINRLDDRLPWNWVSQSKEAKAVACAAVLTGRLRLIRRAACRARLWSVRPT